MKRNQTSRGTPGPFLLWTVVLCLAVCLVFFFISRCQHMETRRRLERLEEKIKGLSDRPGKPGARRYTLRHNRVTAERTRRMRTDLLALQFRLAGKTPTADESAAFSPETPSPPGENRTTPAQRYLRAVHLDRQKYTASQLAEIDDLYRKGMRSIETAKDTEALDKLIEDFPESNRAGCAAMNMGATYLNDGMLEDAKQYLEQVIKTDSQAVFRNGEPVLPKALYNYGMMQSRQGDTEGARATFQRILEEFPDEKDGRGTSYSTLAGERLNRLR